MIDESLQIAFKKLTEYVREKLVAGLSVDKIQSLLTSSGVDKDLSRLFINKVSQKIAAEHYAMRHGWHTAFSLTHNHLKIHPHAYVLSFTGPPGSDKSTLAMVFEHYLHTLGLRTFLLDAKHVKKVLCRDLAYSANNEEAFIRHVGERLKQLVDMGIIVVTTFSSPCSYYRQYFKQRFGGHHFTEIYCRCSPKVCQQRLEQGLDEQTEYDKANPSPEKEMEHAELIIDTDLHSVEKSVDMLADHMNLPVLESKRPSKYRCVWVTGMPRSGSMWTFNVTRMLLRNHYKVVPELVPHYESVMERVACEVIVDGPPNTVAVVKQHKQIRQEMPYSRFICTRRDPRDALLSFMRFMRCDFEAGLVAFQSMIEISDYYRTFPAEKILILEYHDIVTHPIKTIKRIAAFLGLDLPSTTIDDIEKRFQKEHVAKTLSKLHQEVESKISQHKPLNQHNIIHLEGGEESKKEFRIFDPNTGFQTSHVSSYTPGGWRKQLTPSQQSIIKHRFGHWLEQNGYFP